jgi:hypothetical protein
LHHLVEEHLERWLGPVREVFAHDEGGQPLQVPIGAVHDAPFTGAVTLVTLGLSDFVLEQEQKAPVRQELILAYWSRFGFRNAPALLDHFASMAIHRRRAFLRGEWDSYNAPIIDGTNLTALIIEPPLGYVKGLSQLSGAYPEPVVVASIVPLTAKEAGFRDAHGWRELEHLLDNPNVDLLDLERPSAV